MSQVSRKMKKNNCQNCQKILNFVQKIFKKIQNCQNCQKLSKLSKMSKNCQKVPKFVNICQNCQKLSKLSSKIVINISKVRSLQDCSQEAFSKLHVLSFICVFVFDFVKFFGHVFSSLKSNVSGVTVQCCEDSDC